MRVLVCGGRNFTDWPKLFEVLDKIHAEDEIELIIEGGALGADRLAMSWAHTHDVKVLTFSADWDRFGRAAGPIRNAEMLEKGHPDLVVAFPGGKGTAGMVALAREAGVEVREIE